MNWINIITHIFFGITGILFLIDLIKGVTLFKESTPIPTRKDIASTYIAGGLFGVIMSLLFIISTITVAN